MPYYSLSESGSTRGITGGGKAREDLASYYMVRPSLSEEPTVRSSQPKVDIVPVSSGKSYFDSSCTSQGRTGLFGGSGGQSYYTDKNYPDHFWESATSIHDMLKKN